MRHKPPGAAKGCGRRRIAECCFLQLLQKYLGVHKFLDQSFSEAGASVKSRAVFRVVYCVAHVVVRVKDANGEMV